MRTPIALALFLAACGSAGASDPNLEPASTADVSALIARIDALEKDVAALKRATGTDGVDGLDGGTATAPTYWLYDGNGVKKWKVGSTPDTEHLFEVEPGFWIGYSTHTHGAKAISDMWNNPGLLYYQNAGCTGTAYLPGSTFNTIYGWAGWAMKITKDTPVTRNFTAGAYKFIGTGQCANTGGSVVAIGYAVSNTYQANPPTALTPFEIRPE